jgi:uncharacterized protein with PIN domain
MKFLVDQPLGGLAKWLRLCGFDAAEVRFSRTPPGGLPVPAPDTYLLTRQQRWARLGRPDLLILTAEEPESQLKEVLDGLNIPPQRFDPLSRCSRCNELLAPVARETVLDLVPDYVFHNQSRFYQCPRCRRVFWPGSHLKGIGDRIGGGN